MFSLLTIVYAIAILVALVVLVVLSVVVLGVVSASAAAAAAPDLPAFPPAPVALHIPGPVVPANNPVFPSSQPGSSPSTNPNDYQYGEREMWGSLRQRWIDDANEPNCTVQALDFEFRDLTHAKHRSQRWTSNFNRWGPRPAALQGDLEDCGLPVGNEDYHDIKISRNSVTPHPKRGMGTNFYHISTAMGVIVLRNVDKYDGPWWSQVALAQYDIHFARNILRHVYLENVVNEDTRNFIQTIWANTQPPNSQGFDRSPASVTPVAWNFDTPEYKAILGTELGKGVAAIVLSAFPRGTHRITRVVVWKKSIMQIRFDIENKAYL
ncbi:hypothetical protein N7471_005648 [Penicillium samsonianum]|uniref:uncharacterized protein n=1 Tax=Penicillium samsonianum TaxID=1882272 RepID=UPI00254778B9|nr:uncharacterized protein N7471_005648 [Penicillium samsonianum]KAJ6139162.1 hypothetical protein N7471_005648 [Penicillium samsonianum]